jgi:hypothetical protein
MELFDEHNERGVTVMRPSVMHDGRVTVGSYCRHTICGVGLPNCHILVTAALGRICPEIKTQSCSSGSYLVRGNKSWGDVASKRMTKGKRALAK